ncbi:MAG: hypothetical protein AAF791_06470 [Bacteroidota bacterium]
MRVLILALLLLAAGCGSTPPPAPPEAPVAVTEAEDIDGIRVVFDDPAPPPPPRDPLAAFPQCRVGSFGTVFGFTVPSWVSAVGPLLGCPAETLDQPEMQFTNSRTTETVDGLTRVRAKDPNDSALEVAFDLRDGRIVRATRWMTPDAQRIVSFFRLEAETSPSRLGAEPVVSTDTRQVYAPSDEHPFWIDFFRTPDALLLQITDAADLAPDLEPSGTEAEDLAAGGAPCDADFDLSSEAFMFSEIAQLAARLGCPYADALADLGLSNPIEAVEAPDGSTIHSFAGLSRIQPALLVSTQQKADRLASIAVQWPGEATAAVSFLAARVKALSYVGDPPDLDQEAQAMWFDDEDLRVGIVVQQTASGARLQLVDSRWY